MKHQKIEKNSYHLGKEAKPTEGKHSRVCVRKEEMDII